MDLKQIGVTTEGRLLLSLVLLLAMALVRFLIRAIWTNKEPILRTRYMKNQIANTITSIIGVLGLSVIWFEAFQSVFTFLGLVVGALVIVSKELVLNIIANGVILWRGPFAVGDRVAIGDYHGDVMETGLLYITLSEITTNFDFDSSSGIAIKVPNAMVLTQPVRNISRGNGLIKNHHQLFLTLESDLAEAEKILYGIIYDINHKFTESDLNALKDKNDEMLFISKDPTLHLRIMDGKAQFDVHYICKFADRRGTEDQFWKMTLQQFSDAGIQLV